MGKEEKLCKKYLTEFFITDATLIQRKRKKKHSSKV
jgi:hypothetical protein